MVMIVVTVGLMMIVKILKLIKIIAVAIAIV